MEPIVLPANQPRRFYRGGQAIAEFRGEPAADDFRPEDWVASTTTLFGHADAGLTVLADGTPLRETVAADPDAFLGVAHTARFGADPAVLVKLLDAGERLPVHAHPDREFSRRHLDCFHGKTEAWVVIGCRGERPRVHLGFCRDVAEAELRGWVDAQDADAMLEAMHAAPVAPGDAVLVPAGTPHAIGEGVFVVELQEPTDLSVLLEWEGFDLDGPRDGHLRLGFDTALCCVDRHAWPREALDRLRRPHDRAVGAVSLFGSEAAPFFRCERLRAAGDVLAAEPGYSVLVATAGEGRLDTDAGAVGLQRGMTVLLPHAAGAVTLSGDVEVLRCRPPVPAQA